MILTKTLLTWLLLILFHEPVFSATEFPDSYISQLTEQFESRQVISVKDMQPGSIKKVRYGEFIVYIYRRTSNDLDYLNKQSTPKIFELDEHRWKKVTKLFRQTTLSRIPNFLIRESQKQFTGLPFRSLNNDVFVAIARSPRHGCHVKFLHPDIRSNKFEIFLNVCLGERYDSAGREISPNGIPKVKGYNLFIPPYTYNNDNNIVLGGFTINLNKAFLPVNYQGLTFQQQLWLACQNNDYSAALEALNNDADPNLKEEHGNSLDYAITGSDMRLIKLLIKNGAQSTSISREMANIVKRKEILLLLDELKNN